MPIPLVIGLYAAAGALAGASIGGVHVLARRGQQDGAAEEASRDIQHVKNLLQQHIDLADLTAQAEELGVDVGAVVLGYERLKSDAPSLDGLLALLEDEGVEIPTETPELTARSVTDEITRSATSSEIREWARQNEYDVADYGPVPKHIKKAYWESH